jgi:hypothetical protein
MAIFKVKGNIDSLESAIDFAALVDESMPRQIGIAHTRWATHGEPSTRNAHPHASDASNAFVVVHNGIVSNYAALKASLVKAGYAFQSDTDTEVIAVFLKFTHDKNPHLSFKDVVVQVAARLQGAYALIIKSSRFPGELIATKRGGPLILGIVGNAAAAADESATSVPITYVAAGPANMLPSEDAAAIEVAISSVEAHRTPPRPSRTSAPAAPARSTRSPRPPPPPRRRPSRRSPSRPPSPPPSRSVSRRPPPPPPPPLARPARPMCCRATSPASSSTRTASSISRTTTWRASARTGVC